MNSERHYVSPTTTGERCSMCGDPATHKVGEQIAADEPIPVTRIVSPNAASAMVVPMARHEFTAYVCCSCFRLIMGIAVFCPEPARIGVQCTGDETI